MRFMISVFAAAAIFLTATASTATVTLTVVGKNLTTGATTLSGPQGAVQGDQIRIDIFMRNTSTVESATLSASVDQGLGIGVPGAALNFESGLTGAFWFAETQGKLGEPLNGIDNTRGVPNPNGSYASIALPRSLASGDIVNGAVQFFNGSDVTNPRSGTGLLDYAVSTNDLQTILDDHFVSSGAAHARLIFTLVGSSALLQIGLGPDDGVFDPTMPNVDPADNIAGTSILIGMIPEPGTALLLGLGLSALSMTRRQRSHPTS